MSAIDDIKKAIESKKTVVGTERVLKGLKNGEISTVYVTVNTPEDVKEDITHYAELSSAKVVKLKHPNDELGALCKKPFSISVLGISK